MVGLGRYHPEIARSIVVATFDISPLLAKFALALAARGGRKLITLYRKFVMERDK